MLKGIFPIFFFLCIFNCFVSDALKDQIQRFELFTETVGPFVFNTKNGHGQNSNESCHSVGCTKDVCSCIPRFTLDRFQFTFFRNRAICIGPFWPPGHFYKSHEVVPELRPPRFS